MSASRISTADPPGPPDFSMPWKYSDVVLVVERQNFHVHRYTLAMWSPVFEKMLTLGFKEKNSCEIPLPGKKASEIKELLLVIYPTISGKAWRTVTTENCYFLLKLADEYQMEDIRKRCEDVLVDLVSKKMGNSFLSDVTFAQTQVRKTTWCVCGGGGGNRGAGARENRGREGYGRRERKGREAGVLRGREAEEKCETLFF